MKELIDIQKDLKAPKGQYNSFGKYKYRSAEDILEAVKPLCCVRDCQLTLSDDVVLIGDRFYVKATATIVNASGETTSVSAFAREEDAKKGMDGSQITGTASSYARKYALNGLFCIDDTKDADTDEYAKTTKKSAQTESETPQADSTGMTYREKVIVAAKERGISFGELAKDYGLNGSTTEERFKEVLADLEGR